MTQTDVFVIQEGRRTSGLFAWWALWIIVGMLLAWVYAGESGGRHIIYALPVFLVAVYLVLNRTRARLDGSALVALGLYAVAALASLAVNLHLTFLAQRDLLIIGSYIVIFCLYMEAPAAIADVLLVALAVGMVIETEHRGIGADINFAASQGLVESILAFPLGALLIYYLNARRWGRALLTAILFLIAFKRIALLGVAAAVALDFLTRPLSQTAARRVFFAAVIAACVVALTTLTVFNELANMLGVDNGNAVSLGRSSIATELWSKFSAVGAVHWVFGSGPAAADSWVIQMLTSVTNPLNDWLKILIDYGAFGLVLWHGILARLYPRSRLGNQLYLYGAILMITDNTIIYLFYFAVVFLISHIGPKAQTTKAARR